LQLELGVAFAAFVPAHLANHRIQSSGVFPPTRWAGWLTPLWVQWKMVDLRIRQLTDMSCPQRWLESRFLVYLRADDTEPPTVVDWLDSDRSLVLSLNRNGIANDSVHLKILIAPLFFFFVYLESVPRLNVNNVRDTNLNGNHSRDTRPVVLSQDANYRF
jgi:hypothetical protein